MREKRGKTIWIGLNQKKTETWELKKDLEEKLEIELKHANE